VSATCCDVCGMDWAHHGETCTAGGSASELRVSPTPAPGADQTLEAWRLEQKRVTDALGEALKDYTEFHDKGLGGPWTAEAGKPLPSVAGRMEMTHQDFQRACRVELERLQAEPSPDNALVRLLCEAVRCSRECCGLAKLALKAAGAAEPAPKKGSGEVTLTVDEIFTLAQFAGLRVEDPGPEEGDYEVTVGPWPSKGVRDGDTELPEHRHVAYYADYPEEGCACLGSPVDPLSGAKLAAHAVHAKAKAEARKRIKKGKA